MMDGNTPPVANLGPDFTIKLNQKVKLNAGQSFDEDGDLLSYRWALTVPKGSTAILSSKNHIETEFKVDIPGTYVVELIVNDGRVDSNSDKAVFKTKASENKKPVAEIFPLPTKIPAGVAVKFDGSGSKDPEGKALSFDWLIESSPEGSIATFDNTKAKLPIIVPDKAGEYQISLVVNDGEFDSEPAVLLLSIDPPENLIPVADAGSDFQIGKGDRVQLNAVKSMDPENEKLIFQWTMKKIPKGSSASLSNTKIVNPIFVADKVGNYQVELRVSDGKLTSLPVVLNIEAKQGNLAPIADAGLDFEGMKGMQFSLDGSASVDPEGATLSYAWALSRKPAGSVAILENKTFVKPSFMPDRVGEYEFSLLVNDGELSSASDSVMIMVRKMNASPTSNAGLDITTFVGKGVSLDGTASIDPDGDRLTYQWSIVARPSGSTCAFDHSNSSTPSFTPDKVGDFRIELVVNDGKISSRADLLDIHVTYARPSVEGELVITEIMMDPKKTTDAKGEWFELYNPTTFTFDLKNCVLSDLGSDSHTITRSLLIPPQMYISLARSSVPGFTPDYVYTGFTLGNSGDEIIVTCDSHEISNILIDTSFSIQAGKSIALINGKNEIANDHAINWCSSILPLGNGDFGSPGADNMLTVTCP